MPRDGHPYNAPQAEAALAPSGWRGGGGGRSAAGGVGCGPLEPSEVTGKGEHAGTAVYRDDIDGLRALAVLAVIVFHMEAGWLPGGFWGVDVFFVISGYLITSIILRELEAGRFSLRAFWLRRVRRLVPALLAVVAVVLVAGNALLMAPQRNWLPWDAAAAVFSFSNILIHDRVGNYWGELAETLPLLHTWSLSVEEQFYLVLAPLLWGVWRAGRSVAGRVVAGLAALSFVACVWQSQRDASAAFYLLPTRMWELLAGSLLAFGGNADRPLASRWLQEAGLAAGIVMIVASFIWLAGLPGLPGAYPLVPCLGAVLVIRCGRHSQLAQATLATLPLRTIGRISYSLYLWHWPVLVFHRQRFDALPTWLLPPVIGLLGAASYRWIETPFRKPGSPWRRALALGGLTAAAASLAIILVPVNSMLGGEFADLQSPEAQTNGMAWDATKPIRETGEPLRIGENRSQIIAVYGSSHARMMSPPLVEAVQAGAPFSLILLGSSGNGVTVETEPEFNARRLAILEKAHPSVILVFDKWNWLAEQPDFDSALARELRALAACSPSVLVHSQPPMPILPAEHEKQLYRYLVATHQPDPRLKPNPVVPAANDRVRRVVESLGLPGVRYVDTYASLIRDDGSVRVKQAGQFLYFDWNHLNHRGARVVYARHVRPLLETAKP